MHIPSITNTIENRLLAILSFMLVAHFSVSYTYLISMHFFFVIINGCTHNTWIHVDLIQIDECILSCIIIDVLTKTSNTSVNQIFSSILLESKQMQFIWNASKMRTWHIHFFIHSSILCLCVCVSLSCVLGILDFCPIDGKLIIMDRSIFAVALVLFISYHCLAINNDWQSFGHLDDAGCANGNYRLAFFSFPLLLLFMLLFFPFAEPEACAVLYR